jgi:hypothetical protein
MCVVVAPIKPKSHIGSRNSQDTHQRTSVSTTNNRPGGMLIRVHYAKKAVALYKVLEFDNCEIRNVILMRIGHRSKMQEYAR